MDWRAAVKIRFLLPLALWSTNTTIADGALIEVVNSSIWATDDQVSQWTAAVGRQVTEHVAPAWNVSATVRLVRTTHPGAWVCRLYDGDPQNPQLGLTM
jgi:hypothetical protein